MLLTSRYWELFQHSGQPPDDAIFTTMTLLAAQQSDLDNAELYFNKIVEPKHIFCL